MTIPAAVSIADMIAEVRRELRLREVAYPRMVTRGILTGKAADRQVARLKAVLKVLEDIAELDADPDPPPEAA